MKPITFKFLPIPSALIITLFSLLASTASAFEGELEGELKDAWLTGKAEMVLALNYHLNKYNVTARVTDGVVSLNGSVGSDISKSLATELMKGIADIRSVENNLQVDTALDESIDCGQVVSRRSFARWIDDLTTTAIIRTKLLSNANVGGLSIEVETRQNIVTLKGQVDSQEESALVEEIVRNTGDVATVRNNLLITTAN